MMRWAKDLVASTEESDSVTTEAGGAGMGDGDLMQAYTTHLMQRHNELATVAKQVLGLIEQYTRFDYFMWLTHDPSGMQSDPCAKAAEAKKLLTEFFSSDNQPPAHAGRE